MFFNVENPSRWHQLTWFNYALSSNCPSSWTRCQGWQTFSDFGATVKRQCSDWWFPPRCFTNLRCLSCFARLKSLFARGFSCKACFQKVEKLTQLSIRLANLNLLFYLSRFRLLSRCTCIPRHVKITNLNSSTSTKEATHASKIF